MSGPSTLAVTFFKSYAASEKVEQAVTIEALADRIRKTTAREKKALPWLKLARFGEARTENRSLRHDANVLTISGIEVDYDDEKISIDTALNKLTQTGLSAILYTSPSHTDAAPRWRVLCPTSIELPPDKRKHLIGRINGLFGGTLANESWTLSQSYYLGSVNRNPAHRVEVIDGAPIDTLDELDVIWRGPPDTQQSTGTRIGRVDEPALLQAIVEGRSYHEAAVRLLSRWARSGISYMDARKRLLDAMKARPEAERDDRWRDRMADVDRCLEDIYGKQARKADEAAQAMPDTETEAGSQSQASDDPVAALLARFNSKFMVVNEAGKAVVLQPRHDPVLKRRQFDRLTFRDLEQLYMNDMVCIGSDGSGKPVYKTAASIWLKHRERRQYVNGVTFDPTAKHDQPGVLNLWEGFAVKAEPGDWSIMRSHIQSIVCDSDPVRFDYLMGWLARAVQFPAEQGETAVIMKGGEGCGKGTLARALLRIMGQHGLSISNGKHLVGNFNGHLRDVVLLFADEALFAGDKSHVGVLKNIITEPHLTIEAKFSNAITMPNYLHLMMASNEEWVVPAALDSRRFFVLDVPGTVMGDHGYFDAIWRQMDAGGYEAMLHELLHRDLTCFNVRAVPQTEGLQQQRKLSLGTTEAWWLDCLERGYVFRSKLGLDDTFSTWLTSISTELLVVSYQEFAKGRNERRPLSREHLGEFFCKVLKAKPIRLRRAPAGEALMDVENVYGGMSRKAAPVIHPRPPGYAIGNLDDARRDFLLETGLSVTWDGGAIDDGPDRQPPLNASDPFGASPKD